MATTDKDNSDQSDKFKQAARDLEADESEANWEERLKNVVKQKPTDKKAD